MTDAKKMKNIRDWFPIDLRLDSVSLLEKGYGETIS